MQYFYYKKRILRFEDEFDTSKIKGITQLNDEQLAFYSNNKDASLEEILACELYAAPIPTLEEYKERKIFEMSELSKMKALEEYPQYVRDNIFAGVYEDSDARKEAMSQYFTTMRNEFYAKKELIENAESKEDVDIICSGNNFDIIMNNL